MEYAVSIDTQCVGKSNWTTFNWMESKCKSEILNRIVRWIGRSNELLLIRIDRFSFSSISIELNWWERIANGLHAFLMRQYASKRVWFAYQNIESEWCSMNTAMLYTYHIESSSVLQSHYACCAAGKIEMSQSKRQSSAAVKCSDNNRR